MIWPLGHLPRRSTFLERLDSPDIDDAELSSLFDFHDSISRWTGGRSIVLDFLAQASRAWAGPVTILDMSCGRGDLSRSIVKWARRKDVEIRVHGVDHLSRAIQMA